MLNRFERKIITSIRVIPVLVVIIFTMIITYILFTQSEIYFQNEEKKLKNDFIQTQKKLIKHEVEIVYNLIEYEKNNTTYKLKENLKNRVYEAYNIIINIYKNNKNESPQKIKQMIKNSLEHIRFNDSRGYYFIFDLKGNNIMHPLIKSFEGKNIYDYTDLKGKKVIQSLINKVKNNKEDFDTWHWYNPNDLKNEYEKIGFVKIIEELDWFIGTGEYLIDFEESIKEETLKRISQIKYDENAYVFILNHSGKYLHHINKTLLNSEKDVNTTVITNDIIKKAKESDGFLEHTSLSNDRYKNKISYVKSFSSWNWIIGSSFSPDLVNERIKERYKLLQKNYEETKNKIYLSVVTIMVIILFLLFFFSKEIEKLFKKYRLRNSVYQSKLKDLLTDKTKMLDSSLHTIDKYVSITKTDLNGVITYATRNFCEGVGYSKEELIGKNHNIVRHPDTDPLLFKDLWETIRKGNVYKTTLKNRTKDGGEIWFEIIINPDFDFNKNIIGYTAIRRNITDKKIIEDLKDRLEIRVAETIQKSREKDNLLAHQSKMAAIGEMLENIAHQWRQPLSVISTAASGLELQKEYGLLNEVQFEKSMKTILENTEYLSKTIDSFRDFFSSSNKLELVSLKNSYLKAKGMFDSNKDNKPITFIEEIDDLELVSYGNELVQIFLNIFSNTNDAFEKNRDPNNKKYIFVTIVKENQNAVISIKDNAGGIPKNIINKIFEPYFTTKHQAIGTGIGLYMCMEIITKQMQGKIAVKNRDFVYDDMEFTGAEFKITLPLNPKEKLLKKIKRFFSYMKCYEWIEDKTLFSCNHIYTNDEISSEIDEITNFLHKFGIKYNILENKDIVIEFN